MLVAIVGATATGKSGLALALAQRMNSVIISADSRQIYREFDIGTAKPSWAERQTVPHFLIDCCDPREVMTLADYQQQVYDVMNELPKGHVPLLVGGTGLYIKAIVQGLKIPRVSPNPNLRSQLQAIGQPQCYAMLQKVDAIACQRIHPNDQVRTIRALEVFYTTGRPISEQQGEQPPTYPILQIGLDCLDDDAEGDRLTQRIQQRTLQMIDLGFVDEVERLCQTYGHDLPLLSTLGYQEMKGLLAGDYALPDAIQQTVLHTRQFAKRQRTWFRADPRIHWFDSDAPDLLEQVWHRVQLFLSEAEATAR